MEIGKIINRENAIFSAKVAVGVVVVGAGILMESAGTALIAKNEVINHIALKNLGHFLKTLGSGTFQVGKFTSYTVLVPAYMLGYELPKWLIQHGIPKGIALFKEHVFQPLVKSLEWLAAKTIEGISFAVEHYLRPAIEKITQVANDCLVQPLIVGVKWFAERVIELMDWTYHTVLLPVKEVMIKMIRLAAENILEPLGRGLKWVALKAADGLEWTVETIIMPMFKALEKTVQWAIENLFQPFFSCLKSVAIEFAEFSSKYFFTPLHSAAIWVGENLFQPVACAAHTLWLYALDYVLKPLFEGVVNGAALIYRNILYPIGDAGVAVVASLADLAGRVYIAAKRDISFLLGN